MSAARRRMAVGIAWRRVAAMLPGVGVVLLPAGACPACWPLPAVTGGSCATCAGTSTPARHDAHGMETRS